MTPRVTSTSVAVALLLAACGSSSGDGSAPATAPGLVVESGNGKATLGSAARVPDGFPAEIPLATGTLTDGTSGTSEGKQLFNLTYEVADGKVAMATVASGLTTAGYDVKPALPTTDGSSLMQEATSTDWYVLLAAKANVKTGVPLLVYFVRQR